MKRRDFLIQGAALAGGMALPRLAGGWPSAPEGSAAAPSGVAIICDPEDAVVASRPVEWAIGVLRTAFEARGATVRVLPRLGEARQDEACVVVAAGGTAVARDSHVALPGHPESLALAAGHLEQRPVLFALGSDARGLTYALTELAEQVVAGEAPREALIQQPSNRIRSVMRQFVSDVEDKLWFYDRDFWRQYLALLVAQRFNRANLSFGLGYDLPQQLKDTYFYFTYPFLLKVPGYDVRASNLPDAERDRNLEQLRFISDEAAAHGLDFQLGLWTHAYTWIRSPGVNHVIEGLTPETHAPYCRDALRLLLGECPNITGVTLRIHGESGVPEGSYGLWRTIFEGVKAERAGGSDRPVLLDLHAKGIDQPTLDAALAVGVPLTISPKFWAEHMGLPYHQADIRPNEIPPSRPVTGQFVHSAGDRSFTRYGYADLLREDRRYGVVPRIWPGTQRVLLWSDPAMAAAYGRSAGFCGCPGIELMEPLNFKGRKGSGLPGGRDGYADLSLRAPGADFEKYRLTYTTWGRALYDPEAPAAAWSRRLTTDYGRAGASMGQALSRASRILPLLTTAHLPSAANNLFWPEMYANMPIADPTPPAEPYDWDSPAPRRFGTVSPLDPQIFSRIEDFAGELLADKVGGKYSPAEVAQWLEDLADNAEKLLGSAAREADRRAPAFRRAEIDLRVQAGLGRFFAWKLRAGTLYALYQRTGSAPLQAAALDAYGRARAQYAAVADLTKGVYVKDMTYGPVWYQRGHWADRLAAMDRDIAAMKRGDTAGERTASDINGTISGNVPAGVAVAAVKTSPISGARARDLIQRVLRPPQRPVADAVHHGPPAFTRNRALELALALPARRQGTPSVTLHYRHVNQGERWQAAATRVHGTEFRAAIPAEYADGVYPLQYYFEIAEHAGQRWMYPALGSELTHQPYFVVRPGPAAASTRTTPA